MEPSEKDIEPQVAGITTPEPAAADVQAVEDEPVEAVLVDEPAETEPVAEEPVEAELVDEPAVAEPVAEEPVAAELVDEPAEAEPVAEEPVADEPVAEDLISRELETKLALGDAEPPVPVTPDLAAVEPGLPSTSGPATNLDMPAASGGPAPATNLDLPSLDLPHPAYPQPQQVPPAAVYQTPGQAYGQTPYAMPSPPPPQSFGQTPYAVPEPPTAHPGPGQQFSQPAYPPPAQYGQQLAYTGGGLSASEEATWAPAAHWSAILASFVGLGFLGPLIIMLTQGTKSARVRANAVESLNFEITYVLSMFVSVLLMLVAIGFVTTFIIPVIWLVFRIVASVQTSNGQDYRYPVNLRLVK